MILFLVIPNLAFVVLLVGSYYSSQDLPLKIDDHFFRSLCYSFMVEKRDCCGRTLDWRSLFISIGSSIMSKCVNSLKIDFSSVSFSEKESVLGSDIQAVDLIVSIYSKSDSNVISSTRKHNQFDICSN